jgi:hypothetical protein
VATAKRAFAVATPACGQFVMTKLNDITQTPKYYLGGSNYAKQQQKSAEEQAELLGIEHDEDQLTIDHSEPDAE